MSSSLSPFLPLELDELCSNPTIGIIGTEENEETQLKIIQMLLNKIATPEIWVACSADKRTMYSFEGFSVQFLLNEDMLNDILKEKRQATSNATPWFIVLDDKWLNTHAVHEILYNGRHFNVSSLMIMPSSTKLPPSLRMNLDYVWLLADELVSNRKRMYNAYGGVFPDFEEFDQTFSKLATDQTSMVLVQRGASHKVKYTSHDFIFLS